MFFNQHDVVLVGTMNCLVLFVNDETLVVFDLVNLKNLEVAKSECKRISTMAEIRAKAHADATSGDIEYIRAVLKVGDIISNLNWIENASMNHNVNAWLYGALKSMEVTNKDTGARLQSTIKELKVGDKTQFNVTGKYEGNTLTIRLSLVNKNGVVSVNNVKRIFGDDGIFGNIKRLSNTKNTPAANTNPRRSIPMHQKSRIAS